MHCESFLGRPLAGRVARPGRRSSTGFPAAFRAVLLFVGLVIPVSAAPWPRSSPEDAGLSPQGLEAYARYVGGRGCVVRRGQLVYEWGEAGRAGDVASACKPVFTHFLLLAWQEGKIPSLDQPVRVFEPRLAGLNPALGGKDGGITWRHFATQTSCYGLVERPGTAFAYNDWQMALFIDLLFPKVWGLPWPEVDARLFHARLTEPLGCEDGPTLNGGVPDRAGRLTISPRDFARFGQLYLQRGLWEGRALLREDLVRMAVGSPLPASLPRAGTNAAPMLPGQRSLGSRRIPDNQTKHFGSYSLLWWVNGIQADGRRHWPDAPADLFAALGHGGIRGLAVIPSLDLVVSWNDTRTNDPSRENEAFRLLGAAVWPLTPR